jgi:radical SAM protein with 4Fe4S-binding SPASM domain
VIPYQHNVGGIVALLPDGRVEFLHATAQPFLTAINHGQIPPDSIQFDDYIINDPLVQLDRFHLSAPAIVFIETTNLCNLRCKHCYANSAYKRPNELETDIILGLIDELAEIGVLQVFLTGGELFAHPDAVKIVQHARSKDFSTQIFTNGLLITEEILSQIPAGTSFFVSFDTADPTRTIRGKMDFPTLRNLFESMTKHGHVFRTAISVHRNNLHDAEEIFEWCAEHNFPRPQWLETHPIGRALLHPDMLLRPEQVDEAFDIYERCMERYSVPPDEEPICEDTDENVTAIKSVDTVKFCQRLERATGQEKCARSIAYVNSAGDVFPCSNCMSNRMFPGGNLREKSFAEIWSEGFDSFRQITFDQHEVCSSCPVNHAGVWCQFRCPPLASNISGDPLGCGATEYLKLFMVRAHQYWEDRRANSVRLTLDPQRTFGAKSVISH